MDLSSKGALTLALIRGGMPYSFCTSGWSEVARDDTELPVIIPRGHTFATAWDRLLIGKTRKQSYGLYLKTRPGSDMVGTRFGVGEGDATSNSLLSKDEPFLNRRRVGKVWDRVCRS